MKYGRFKAALADYEEAVKLERTAEHLYGKGVARQRLDDRAGSDDKARARSLDPGVDSLFVYYGFTRFEIPENVWQQYDDACRNQAGSHDRVTQITSCSMLIESGFLDHRNQAMALAWRGHLYSDAGRTSEAKADLDRSLALTPEKAETWWGRAMLRAKLKDYAGAKADYDEALRRAPQSAYALYGRGFVRLRLGDRGGSEDVKAARQFDAAVEPYYARNGMQAD
jgi:tetratricopeptide (TPR) repeat protein